MDIDQMEQVTTLILALATKGILAVYGGRKGHGFWLYPASPETIARWNATRGYTHLDDAGPCIQNDGQRSGNPYFTMFEDAEKLAQ